MYLKRLTPVALVLAFLAAIVVAQAHFVTPDQVDWKAILPQPPAADSDQAKQELAQMLKLQASRTPDQAKRCRAEVSFTPFIFSQVLGSWFNPDDLPQTAKLLRQVNAEAGSVCGWAKVYYDRTRPFVTDPSINPCIQRDMSPSYPSGHSTRAMTLALVLCQMFPQQKDGLMALGTQIGDDRVLGGVHYPSDVASGRILAKAIVQKMLANDDFKAAMEKARAECQAKEPANQPATAPAK